ncbi:hypothetical protein F383_38549 [Gossypium arboreum]|uniref:Uncharacterized protein n=1 Tax=Gossypium arboreum TaxID=29729 RepID=A0A0B0MJF9_GOSAR|nr:hypothetical protein F383_38549 [Gossypium arboreum]
MNSKLRSVNFP